MPMPDTGCPSDGSTEWKTGWTYHDTEDDNNDNQRSNIFHMPVNFSAHGIQQKFCLKVGNNGNTGSEIWPEGKYCLYKKGEVEIFNCGLRTVDYKKKNDGNAKSRKIVAFLIIWFTSEWEGIRKAIAFLLIDCQSA